MSDGFEEAKSRRNWLERLGDKIPGFRGFQDRELRREVDKLQREHLAERLTAMKAAVRGKAQSFTDSGKIGSLQFFDRLDRRLEGLSQSIRFSDYGATGFFDVVKIGQPELEKLYAFDVAFLEDIGRLQEDLEAIPEPGDGDPATAIEEAFARLADLEDTWAGRSGVISGVVRSVT
jgi:hypothetical protein